MTQHMTDEERDQFELQSLRAEVTELRQQVLDLVDECQELRSQLRGCKSNYQSLLDVFNRTTGATA